MTQEFHSFFLGIVAYQAEKKYDNPMLIDLEMSNGGSSGFIYQYGLQAGSFLVAVQ